MAYALCRVVYFLVPASDGEMTGDERRAAAIVLKDFRLIMNDMTIDRLKHLVIENKMLDLPGALQV